MLLLDSFSAKIVYWITTHIFVNVCCVFANTINVFYILFFLPYQNNNNICLFICRWPKEVVTIYLPANLELASYKVNDLLADLAWDSAHAVVHFYRMDEKKRYEWILLIVNLVDSTVAYYFKSPEPNLAIIRCHLNNSGSLLAIHCKSQSTFKYSIAFIHLDEKSVNRSIALDYKRCYFALHPYEGFVLCAIPHKNNVYLFAYNTHDEFHQDIILHMYDLTAQCFYCHIHFSRCGKYAILSTVNAEKRENNIYTIPIDSLKTAYLGEFSTNRPPVLTLSTIQDCDKCSVNTKPILSLCQRKIAFPCEVNGLLEFKIFQLNNSHSLMSLCRASIMKSIRYTHKLYSLNLPTLLVEYLLWDKAPYYFEKWWVSISTKTNVLSPSEYLTDQHV